MDIITLKSFIPEIFLSCIILVQLVYNVKFINKLQHNFPLIGKEVFYQTLFIIVTAATMYYDIKLEGFLSTFSLVNDEGTRVTKLILLAISFFALYIIQEAFLLQKLNFSEFYSLILFSILSLVMMISSADLLFFYLTMEMQALCFYILASFKRDSTFSIDAGLKYFISGSFASGFYLLGCSLIYGSLGTINLHYIDLLTSFNIDTYSIELNFFVLVGVLLVTATLLFKLACAPFHFWAPEVYDGAPIASTIVFSVLPKLAIIFFFIKWINSLNTLFDTISDVLLVCGVLSTFVGTFFALKQQRLKRLVIFSSIAQTGFLVASLSNTSIDSLSAVYFFLFIYLITSLLIWGHFTVFYTFASKIADFEKQAVAPLFLNSLTNLSKKNSLWAFSLVLIFFSIAGIPPFPGFFAKMLIISGLVENSQIIGACALIIISAVSVYYYIRVIKVAYFEPGKKLTSSKAKFTTFFLMSD